MQGDALGPSVAVIGAGINVRLSDAVRARVDGPIADLESVCGRRLDRNEVLARLLHGLDETMGEFARAGFAPLRAEWQRRHAHQDRGVTLQLPDGTTQSGTARGVAEDGALLLEVATELRRYHTGEITLRPAPRVMRDE
jgi:BirA family biotin operon repressor/biotin-[acetyl-CoA-carboxylase] ligase